MAGNDDATKSSHTTGGEAAAPKVATPTPATSAAKPAGTPAAAPASVSSSGPESLKTDPAQAQRLATVGDTGAPAASEPRPVTVGSVATGKVDPEGRVKQQDAEGRFLADENEIRKDPQALQERQAETRRIADSGNPQFVNAQSGTMATAESLEHDQLVRRMQASGDQPKGAPAVSTDSPLRLKRRSIEEQIKALEVDKTSRAQTSRQLLNAQLAELKEHESQQLHGAPIRQPRGQMLMAPKAQDANPDHHLRWINENAPGRVDAVKMMGYEKVPVEDGGSQRGELALYRVSREARARNVVAQDNLHKERLNQFTRDFEAEAEQVAKYLRDKKGLNISAEELMTREGGR